MSNALCIFTSATVATILVHASMRFTFTTTHYIYIYIGASIYIYIRTLKQPEHICLFTTTRVLLDMKSNHTCPAYVFDYTCPSHCVQQSRFAQSAQVICGML
jgi:hypothetical protein